jgi:hypothetical protein
VRLNFQIQIFGQIHDCDVTLQRNRKRLGLNKRVPLSLNFQIQIFGQIHDCDVTLHRIRNRLVRAL